ncbi:MAG: transposase [Alphaproteobacteria bacterium]|nr:transposase [Alphaproteobacteria bacterium]
MRQGVKDTTAFDHVLLDELEKAGRNGHEKAAKSFADVVFKGAMLIEKAMEQYLDERKEGNRFNNKPLAKTTALDVRTSVRHLIAFLGGEAQTLNDVSEDKVFGFRTAYLLDAKGLRPQTISKHMTLMRGLWTWAITEKRFLRAKGGRPYQNPWVINEVGTPKNKRRTKDNDDDCTRECPAIDVALSIPGSRVVKMLERVARERGYPDVLTVDGPEFRGRALDGWADDHGVQLYFIDPGKPTQNAYIESFNGRFREECLNLNWFTTLAEAERIIENWRLDYNQNRPHSSLNYQTPEEFAANRPFHKPQWALALELPEGSAPPPIAHAAE